MKKTIRVGVAGLGFGASVHVPAFQSLPGVEVVALAGTDKKRAEQMALSLKISRGYGNLEDFFRHDMDAVSLALPPQWNAKAALMAFRRKLPVLIEKPIGGSFIEAKKLFAAGRGKLAMVDFQFSELKAFQELKKLIEGKKYGRVHHASLFWEVESYAHQTRQWSWKTDFKKGGGVLSLLGSHSLYLAEWLFGSIEGMFAQLDSRRTRKIAPSGAAIAPDFFSAILRFKNGKFLTAVISNASPGGIGHRWEITFEKATAVLYNPPGDYMSGFSLVVKKDRHEKILFRDLRTQAKDGRIAPFRSLAQRFIDAIRDRRRYIAPNLSDGIRVQCLMEAAYSSARHKRYIHLPL